MKKKKKLNFKCIIKPKPKPNKIKLFNKKNSTGNEILIAGTSWNRFGRNV